MGRLRFLLGPLIVSLSLVGATLNARAWQSPNGVPSVADYPESAYLSSRPNTAITFMGGGSRAYSAAVGILAGLNELDLIKNIRYIGGISGGSWATTVYTYSQNDVSDTVLLGEVVRPENIVHDELKNMDPNCARSYAAADVTLIATEAFNQGIVNTTSDSWAYSIWKSYLEPAGIKSNTRFSWDVATVEDIKKRNPSLALEEFILPHNPQRPFPLLGTALVGPTAGAPYNAKNQNYTMIEITPLYIGNLKPTDVTYSYWAGFNHKKRVGGAVEPFAFAQKGTGPRLGLSESSASGILQVPEPTQPFDLPAAAGASSYAPGSLVESIPPEQLATSLGLKFDYWSPADRLPSAETTLFADGGCYENLNLISFIQRRVPKVVAAFFPDRPMQPASKYDPYTDSYYGDLITDSLTAFFGVFDEDMMRWKDRAFEFDNNQIFSTVDYAPVVAALQAAQAKGTGIMATFNLTTIENKWWGIPAGVTTEITFWYLGRLGAWEQQLSPEMYKLVVPKGDEDDLGVDVQHGPFRNFPHYFTLGGECNAERANLLADLTGWSVLQNADTFRHMFS